MHEKDKQMLADHYLDFYRLAYDMLHNETDVEDVVQESLATTMSHAMLNNPYNYCMRVVRHNCIRLLTRSAYSLPDHLPELRSEEEDGATEKRMQQLWALKDQLPHRVRNILDLYYEKGYTKAEIAEETGTSFAMVTKLFYKGHVRLKKQMEQIEKEQKYNNND